MKVKLYSKDPDSSDHCKFVLLDLDPYFLFMRLQRVKNTLLGMNSKKVWSKKQSVSLFVLNKNYI